MKAEQVLGFLKKYVDDTVKGMGAIKGEKGDTGEQGIPGEKGADGIDGYSPTVVENANNTEDNYKLDITDVNGTFTTPNLIGKQGETGTTIANEVTYDNAQSGLSSTNIQGAIDEINTNLAVKIGGTIKNINGSFEYVVMSKVANIKVLNCAIVFPSAITTWQDTVLGQINETEYRPIYGFSQQMIVWNTGTGLSTLIQMNINPEGRIGFYCTDKTNLEGLRVNVHFVYI